MSTKYNIIKRSLTLLSQARFWRLTYNLNLMGALGHLNVFELRGGGASEAGWGWGLKNAKWWEKGNKRGTALRMPWPGLHWEVEDIPARLTSPVI